MDDPKNAQPMQKTKPRKKNAKPIEIPVPTRKEVEDLMRGVTGKRPSDAKDHPSGRRRKRS